jgi:hypothetical protein
LVPREGQFIAKLTAPFLPILIAGFSFEILGLVKTGLALSDPKTAETLRPVLYVDLGLQLFDTSGSLYEITQAIG